MNYKKTGKRIFKKATRAVKKRYFKGKGYAKPKYNTMLKDVAFLKKMINAEKKRIIVSNSGLGSAGIGQVNGNASGHYLVGLTPLPPQGNDYNQRTGNSIKWASSFLNFQFVHESATTAATKLTIHIVKFVGLQPTNIASAVLDKYILPNNFISGSPIYDDNSFRNPDYFKSFKIITRKTVFIRCDNISNQPVSKNVKIGIKPNHHIKWATDGTTISEGQVFLLITSDTGNYSLSTNCTLPNVYQTANSTGILMNYNYTHYFIDN